MEQIKFFVSFLINYELKINLVKLKVMLNQFPSQQDFFKIFKIKEDFWKEGKIKLKKSFKKSIVDFLNFNKFSFEIKINFCFSRIKFFLETPP